MTWDDDTMPTQDNAGSRTCRDEAHHYLSIPLPINTLIPFNILFFNIPLPSSVLSELISTEQI